MEDYSFEIENDLGQKATLTSIALIEDPDKNLTYMIYTDSTNDEEGYPNLYVSSVIKEGDSFRLEEIPDYEEIDLITKEMDRIHQEFMNNSEN